MGRRTRWVLIGSVAIVLAASAVPAVRAYRETERDVRAARAAIALGRITQAREPLERWLRARPRSAEAHALRGQVALADGDLAEVTRCMNEARALGYPDEGIERLHAIVLARVGRFAEAEPILVRIWNAEAVSDPMIDEALARVYLKTYRLGEARKVIDRWMHDTPADARPYLWLTEIDRRIEVDNPDSWERHYREALARDPDLDAARLGLADTLARVHRAALADAEYRAYLERHPDDPVALAGAGRTAVELGDLSRGRAMLDRVLAREPSNLTALRGKAELELRQGNVAAAERCLGEVLRSDPFDQESLHRRAGIRARLGDVPGAKADRDALERLKRDQEELLAIRGRVLAEPGNNDLRARVAAWMFAHGRDQEGLGWAMAALASDPGHVPTCRLLADYYSHRPDQAGLANFYKLKATAQRTR